MFGQILSYLVWLEIKDIDVFNRRQQNVLSSKLKYYYDRICVYPVNMLIWIPYWLFLGKSMWVFPYWTNKGPMWESTCWLCPYLSYKRPMWANPCPIWAVCGQANVVIPIYTYVDKPMSFMSWVGPCEYTHIWSISDLYVDKAHNPYWLFLGKPMWIYAQKQPI